MKNFFLLLGLIGLVPFRLFGEGPSILEDRMAKEEKWKNDGLFILPYRPTYLLPFSYNARPNLNPYPPGTIALDKIETKFQFSFKVPLTDHLLDADIAPTLAYTQLSYWQSYNKKESSFFRNTDYEPEFFLQFNHPFELGPFTNRYNRLGYTHQSNGQNGSLSRSWNRLFFEYVVDRGNGFLSLKPWYRIEGPPEKDTNPHMWKYLGYGELRGAYRLGSRSEASFMWRNNLKFSENKGAIELDLSFPLIPRMNGYVQYFNGYGESLLDFNYPVSRFSLGVSFAGWR